MIDGTESGEGTTGLRARKKHATRDLLERTTLRLASQHGYDEVTVEGIATAAGVSTRTFFNYFASKEDAVFGEPKPELGMGNHQRVVESLRTQPAGVAVLEALRTAVSETVHEIMADKELERLRKDVVTAHPMLETRLAGGFLEREQTLAAAIAERTGLDPATEAYPSVAAGAVIGAVRGAVFRWLASESDSQLEAFINEAFELLTRGMAPPD
ncbi:TetR/AcrR family transcriptional regulator [Haloechinothrix alba]|uniref:TetR/AcrR family transcriptional regulator n=1 Tax=Haloechinothrix alba TaxID=664784 RepID=UPI001C3E6595|nr:TetR family transcriptional regulator [Haloechinothrix alba]